MKTLLIIRHAHAESPRLGLSDFDRSLSNRGIQESKTQAVKLSDKNIVVDGWLCSSSKRTMETATILRNHLHAKEHSLLYIDGLYQASMNTLKNQIIQIPDNWSTAAIVAHNPGITDLANTLTDEFRIDDMPPACIVAVSSDTEQWMDFFKNPIRFLFFLISN
jgi:phosphohistidine phosphatase